MEHYLTSVGVEAKEVKLVSLYSVSTELVVVKSVGSAFVVLVTYDSSYSYLEHLDKVITLDSLGVL